MSAAQRLKTKKVKIGSRIFSISSDDDYLIHIGDDFEPDTCKLFETLIKKSYSCVDVGANIGCTSLLFADLAKNVISFEPSPTTYEILSLNIKNSERKNVSLFNFGLGLKKENLLLTFAPSNRSGAFVSNLTKASTGHTTEVIRIITGDEILTGEDIDFIKIDVEGFEKNVLQGLEHSIKKFRPLVVLELNHWCLNAFQRISVPDFIDFLIERFPILYAVEGDKYLDLRNESHRYIVMYQHINHFKYINLVAAFDDYQLEHFHQCYNLSA